MNRNSCQYGRIRPLLVLEFNEIPWRLIDLYAGRGCHNLSRLIAVSETYTTMAVDEGELSPWVTWPSFHRGMGNGDHCVRNLGQPPDTFRGVPIWKEYRQRGLDVGVFGAMQSWPPKDPGTNGFHVPDTFAHDARCIPSYVEPFQRFNLDQVKRNGRVVAEGTGGGGTLLGSLPRLGIRPRTFASLAAQLAGERINPARRARRPVFQTILSWDIFRKLYRPRNPPAYASYFTNHVAGVMHRYWDHVFPEDFPPCS